jgi:hydrogenase maturation protease
MTARILVACIGNIFFGDDAFGVEVARRLLERPLPEGVRAVDFGIRSYDLTFALAEEWEMVILVDAIGRGGAPGTLYLIEPDISGDGAFQEEGGGVVDAAHGMNPASALLAARMMGGSWGACYLVGCEPAALDSSDGEIGLSRPVGDAVDGAVEMIGTLIARHLGGAREPASVPAATINQQQE